MPAPVAGVDGAWACLHCGNVNFAVRTACNRCQQPKQDSAQVAPGWEAPPAQSNAGFQRQGGAPVAGVNGAWACPQCQNVNFAAREVCNRCQAPKSQPGGVGGTGLLMPSIQQVQAPAGTEVPFKPFKPKLQPHSGIVGPSVQEVQQMVGSEGALAGSGGDALVTGLDASWTMQGSPQNFSPKGAPQAGVDGNWVCTYCQNVNFASRIACNRCQAERPTELTEVTQAFAQPSRAPNGAPIAGAGGNWTCLKCKNVNFAVREACNRCHEPKPVETIASDEALFAQLAQHAPFHPSNKGQPQAGVDGNWVCLSCQNVNYAWKPACNRCQLPKPAEQISQAYAFPHSQTSRESNGAPIAGVNGNWMCPKCRNVNFAVREACNRCQEPKPELTEEEYFAKLVGVSMSSVVNGTGSNLEAATGQFARAQTAHNGAPIAGVNGNWACLKCKNVNFGIRDQCNRCQEPKPAEPTMNEFDLFNQPKPADPTMNEFDVFHQLLQQADNPYVEPTDSLLVKGPQAGVGGNWLCPHCNNVNFPARLACNRCQAPRPAELSQEPQGFQSSVLQDGTPIAGFNGNWACPKCQNVNFATRIVCNRCQEPKPDESVVDYTQIMSSVDLFDQVAQPMPSSAGGKGAPKAGIDGNWACPMCMNVNFPMRTVCNRCHAPKPDESQLQGSVPQPSRNTRGAPLAGVDGNWSCLKCRNVNFPGREVCNRCQEPKPIELNYHDPMQHAVTNDVANRGKAPLAGVDGNWACPMCQNVNFPARMVCNRCQTPKPDETEQASLHSLRPQGRGPPIAGVDGNWACPKCLNVNFRMRDVCNRCQEPKPFDAPMATLDLLTQTMESADLGAPPAKRARMD